MTGEIKRRREEKERSLPNHLTRCPKQVAAHYRAVNTCNYYLIDALLNEKFESIREKINDRFGSLCIHPEVLNGRLSSVLFKFKFGSYSRLVVKVDVSLRKTGSYVFDVFTQRQGQGLLGERLCFKGIGNIPENHREQWAKFAKQFNLPDSLHNASYLVEFLTAIIFEALDPVDVAPVFQLSETFEINGIRYYKHQTGKPPVSFAPPSGKGILRVNDLRNLPY